MKYKADQFPARKPKPILSVVKDGKITYSKEADKP